MFGLVNLTRSQRFVLGIFVLLLVDFIWVASSELTVYIFKDYHYDKPFFSTYLKTSMFMLYLVGFLFYKPWQMQCQRGIKVVTDLEGGGGLSDSGDQVLSEPIYVPINYGEDKSSGTESDDGGSGIGRGVRFSKLSEVRQLSESQAEDAVIARLSYTASIRAEADRLRALSKLTIKQVAKISLIFCIVWFFANLAYQEALKDTAAGVVNVLSSTSGLFTLVLAAMFPSCSGDRFTLSKLVAVLLSLSGVVLVSLEDLKMESEIPLGALWSLCGACLYAVYLVMLRRKVENEDKLDIPMFFGFVGLFNFLIIWPGFFILHFSKAEHFEWPTRVQWFYLVLNGVIGTVISEFLWLWGCFLTSSLMATLSIALTIPLTMVADVFVKGVSYTWVFYIGSIPIFLSFFAVSALSHYENWDPVFLAVKKLIHCICRRRLIPRLRDLDREQSESLMGVDGIRNGVES